MLSRATRDQLAEGQLSCRNVFNELIDRIRNYFSLTKKLVSANQKRCEAFTRNHSSYRLHKNLLVKQADVIHLHWVANFIDYQTFFSNKFQIVWSIHDLNPFMGGLHYTIDCDRISSELLQLEMKERAFKHKAIRNKNIHFVFLSKWLYQEALTVAPWLTNEKISYTVIKDI